MNKNSILRAFSVALTACVTFASCDKSPKQETAEEPKQTALVELKVAYVEVDSLMTQYEFCKEYSMILRRRAATSNPPCSRRVRPCSLLPTISSRSCSRMPTRVSRQSRYRQACRSRTQIWRLCSSVSAQSSRRRQTSSTWLCTTHCSTSLRSSTRTRNTPSSSQRAVTTSFMPTRVLTSLIRL